jgi:hypothetical protein
VAIVYDKDKLFEADNPGLMRFNSIHEYDDKKFSVYRLKTLTPEQKMKIKDLCHQYENEKYSVLDITTNALFFWLAAPIRQKVVAAIGNKKFMVCSELVGRIIYESTQFKNFKYFEGLTPEDMYVTCQTNMSFGLIATTLA